MSNKRKLVLSLGIDAQVSSKDLEAFKKTFDTIQSSPLIGASAKSEIQQLEKDLQEIESMLSVTSTSFVDQSDIKNAKLIQNEINDLYKKLAAFKSENLGKFKFDEETVDLKKFNAEIAETESAMNDAAEAIAKVLKLENSKQAVDLVEKNPLAKSAQQQLNKQEFEKDFNMSSKDAGKLITGGYSRPEAVIEAFDKLYASIQNVDQAQREKLISDAAIGKSDEEKIANAAKLTQIMNSYKASRESYGRYSSLLSEEEIKKAVDLYLELKKKKEDLIDTTLDEAKALQKLKETQENAAVAQKQKIVLTAEEKAKNEALKETQEKNSDAVQQLIDRYLSFGAVLALTQRLIREAFSALSNLDKAFVEMAVVTDLSTKQVWGHYQSFKAIAEISGFTTAQIASVTAEYLKQGETMKDALTLTKAASQAAQIAGIAPEESVRYLTSAVRGYRLEAEQAMDVSDKFAAVAAATATDYDGLATAMSKVAAQAYANGVEMDNLMGLLSTAMDVTQEAPENIGTAFKTIFARMTQISNYGATLEDNVDINKVEHALGLVNVALRDSQGNLRQLDKVLLETGAKWQGLNSTQKAYITNTLAGTRQQTRLLAVFENYDKLLENIATSQESAGATAAQQAKYMEGLAAAQNKVQVAWENLIKTISNSDAFIWVLEQAASLLESIADTLKNPVWGTLAGIAGITFGGSALTTGLKKLNDFLKVGKSLGSLRDTFVLLSDGIGDAAKANLTGIAKYTTGIKAAAQAAGLTLGGVATAVAGVGVAVVAGVAIWNHFYKAPIEKSKELNAEITKTEGLIYNITKKGKDLSVLADEYKLLNDKVIKTNEDLTRMAELLELISEFDTDKKFDFSGNGTQNLTNLNLLLKDVDRELLDANEELMATQEELFKNYVKHQKVIAEDLDSATKFLLQKTLGAEKLLKLSASDMKLAQTLIEDLAKNPDRKTVYRNNKTGEEYKNNPNEGKQWWESDYKHGFTKQVLIDYETMADGIKLALDKVQNAIAIMSGEGTISKMADALKTMFSDDELQKLIANSPIMQLVMMNEHLDITMGALNRLAPVMNALGEGTETWTDAEKELVSAQIESGNIIHYLNGAYEDLNITQMGVVNLLGEMSKGFKTITTESLVSDMKNFENLGSELDSINSILESNSWGAESLEKVMNLMTQYPALSGRIIESIQNESKINADVKDAIFEANKNSMIRNIDLAIAEAEAEIAYLEAQSAAFDAMSKDDVAIAALKSAGMVDLSATSTEDIMEIMGDENLAFSAAMKDQLRIAHEAYTQMADMRRAALEGRTISSNKNMLNTQVEFKGVDITSGVAEQEAFIKAQLAARRDDLKKDIETQKNYVKALKHTQDEIGKLAPGSVTGQSKKADDKSSAGKSTSAAAKEAQYYTGVLNKMYVAEQRIKAAQLFIDKNNDMIAYAQSLEAIQGAFEGIDAPVKSSAELMEEQYALYGRMAEEQDNLIAVTKGYQDSLVADLSPALLKTFKIINGRVIPVSEEYGKLTAENMERVDKFAESFNNYSDEMDKATQSSIEFKKAQADLVAEMQDKVIEWQELMIEAITHEEKMYLDSFKRLIDANKKYLNDRKKLYEDSFSAEDADSKLKGIDEERLSLTEKIAALEGAHDQQSLKKKADYVKQLEDLNTQYNEITLQYNRDAFMQRIDDQLAYQDEVFNKEEEAFNERINNAQYLEDRIKEITDKAKADALVDQGLQNMSLEELIRAGYITQAQATELGLDGVKGKVSAWSTVEQQALKDHLATNTEALNKAWGEKTADGQPGAQAIVKAATDNIVSYLQTNLPSATTATEEMSRKSKAAWTALTTAMGEYTKSFNGLSLKAPDSTNLVADMNKIVKDIKNAADKAEEQYKRLQDPGKGSTGSGGGGGSKTTTTTKQNPVPQPQPDKWTRGTNTGGVWRFTNNNGKPARWDYDMNIAVPRYSSQAEALAALNNSKKTTTRTPSPGVGTRNLVSAVYATGGTTERTGLHWLDGSPGKPERVLSAGQNKAFESLIATLDVESKLRIGSYDNSSNERVLKELSRGLNEVAMVLVESDKDSTKTLSRELRNVAGIIEHTNKEQQNHVLKTLTKNKKF